jgi:hypothetical protein
MANQIVELIYDMVDKNQVPSNQLEELSKSMESELQGLLIDIQTVGELITNSADGVFSDTEAMSGHIVTNLGSYGQDLCMVKGFIDTHLKENGDKQS